MLTLATIRKDLKEIRYYYARKKLFEEAFESTGVNEIVSKAKRYTEVIVFASPKLYDLYVSLYINNHTQESLARELCYTPEYVQMLNKKLLKFLQLQLSQKEEKAAWESKKLFLKK